MPNGPEKINAFQKAQKKRRVAQRCQRATRVGDDEDKKDDDVCRMLAVVVGANQGPNQQHGGAGGAHETGQHRACEQQRGIEPGAAVQVAAYENTARYRVQRCQKDDEGKILGQHRMHQVDASE